MYQAVKNQHVFPVKSIKQFYNNDHVVQVKLIKRSKCFSANAKNLIFIAERKWDEEIEKSAINIETAFQDIAKLICEGLKLFDNSQINIINSFYTLLEQRSIAKNHIFTESRKLANVSLFDEMPKDTIDHSESEGIFLGGLEQLDRIGRGLAQRIHLLSAQKNSHVWGVLNSGNLEFLVSDSYHKSPLIPISPFFYLARQEISRTLTDDEVVARNTLILNDSSDFVFARNFMNTGINICSNHNQLNNPRKAEAKSVPPA